jgi:tripartite-type tricarboxylate transporter receptor subunit TctC
MIRNVLPGIAALVFAAVSLTSGAQNFPARSVIVVVPFAAGGPTDTIARIISERMGKSLGQPVVVENTAGAGGSIGVGRVVRAAPDGYIVGIGHVGTHVINGAVHQLPYDLLADLEPVAMVASNPQILVSKMDVPAKDMKEIVAWAKAQPGGVSAGTGGPGTPSHVSAVYFGVLINAPVRIIHYKGSGLALQDVIGGHIDISFDQALNALPQIRGGRVRSYGVTAKTRLAAAPDIPTVDEAGLPGLYMSIWHGFWVPKGTPRAVVDRLNAAVKEALADAGVRKKLEDLGQEIPSVEQQTPEALRVQHKAEIDKWWPVIKQAGIKAE